MRGSIYLCLLLRAYMHLLSELDIVGIRGAYERDARTDRDHRLSKCNMAREGRWEATPLTLVLKGGPPGTGSTQFGRGARTGIPCLRYYRLPPLASHASPLIVRLSPPPRFPHTLSSHSSQGSGTDSDRGWNKHKKWMLPRRSCRSGVYGIEPSRLGSSRS